MVTLIGAAAPYAEICERVACGPFKLPTAVNTACVD